MREIKLSADHLVRSLLEISGRESVCVLDSCGVNHLESHLLIAGIKPLEVLNLTNNDAGKTLNYFNRKLSNPNLAHIFTISYDFGLKLEKMIPRVKEFSTFPEPDIFLASFDCLIIHDYDTKKTFLTGNESRFDEIEKLLLNEIDETIELNLDSTEKSLISSNFSRAEYIEAVEKIRGLIGSGDTYQANLTQQIRARLPENLTPQKIFWNLRKSHPAPFAAFIKRNYDAIVSISPERFTQVSNQSLVANRQSPIIKASPIKGTRPRGKNLEEDFLLKSELLASEKDRAENVMIVDLLRNDIGRICKFGSVEVAKLCDLEIHPTLFHLVSTVRGELRENVNFAEIIRAIFPCGSITGAPKINTMKIIDEIETANRGLSMGAIGCKVPSPKFQLPTSNFQLPSLFDLSVAIRTMVVRGSEAIFNVGGGIVFDSEAEKEFEESLLKAQALLSAINGKV